MTEVNKFETNFCIRIKTIQCYRRFMLTKIVFEHIIKTWSEPFINNDMSYTPPDAGKQKQDANNKMATKTYFYRRKKYNANIFCTIRHQILSIFLWRYVYLCYVA
jgi:hypothetical protein